MGTGTLPLVQRWTTVVPTKQFIFSMLWFSLKLQKDKISKIWYSKFRILTLVCLCEYLQQKDESKVSEDGETKDGHDPHHHGVAEDVRSHKQSNTW